MAINFSAQFIVNEKTSSRVLRLTDTSTGFTLSKGNFIVTFPDGSVASNTDFASPEISAPGGNTSVSLITDTDNTVLTGTYIVSFVALDASLNEYNKSETFDFNWEKPTKAIINDSDVVLPEVQFKDLTAYETSGSFTGVLTRNFYTTTPSTSEVGVITKTSAGDILTPSNASKYYEGIYLVRSDISVAYTHTSKSWLTVSYVDLLQETFDVREAPTQDELVALMNTYKDQIEAYKTTNPAQYEILNEQYDLVLALYSHIIARYQTSTLDGSKAILDQLLGLLPPASSYTYKATQMLPFTINFSTSLTGTGTTGTVPKFTGTTTLGDSIIKEDTNRIGIGKTPTTTLDVNGAIKGTSIVKSGGISSEFLKADGSVDANTYLTTGSAASSYQPLDGDLTAIAVLAGAAGILTKVSANTWTLDTTSYQVLDADLTAIAALAGTSGILIKTAANTWSLDTTSYQVLDADLTAIAALAGTSGLIRKTAANVYELDASVYLTGITSGQVTTALGFTPENAANKGINNGYASLDGAGKVPSTQLPSYVDDVLEVANVAALPATGETGKIYITLDTNKIYRWTGSVYVEISPSVGTVWGGISGTLSNQTDLQTALNAKQATLTLTTTGTSGAATLVGATLNIPQYQGGVTSFNTRTGAITLTSSDVTTALTYTPYPTPAGTTLQYVDGTGALQTFPVLGSAEKLILVVRNTSGATITKGTVVYINGANGNKPTIAKALATGDATSAQTLGLLQADIANNSNGNVVLVGSVIDLDTSAFTEGQQLYLSGVTAGTYTATKTLAPTHLVYVGVIARAHPTQGVIEVKIQNGYELDEIHDVSITSVADNQGLFYESSTSLWKNKSIDTALGFTPQRLDKMVSNLLASDTEYPNSNAVLAKLALKADAASPVFTGTMTISGAEPRLYFTDTDNNPDYSIFADAGYFYIYNQTAGASRFYITDTGVSNIPGDLIVGTIAKSGGTSAQFLKADGSVDTNTYALNSALSSYLLSATAATTYQPLDGDLTAIAALAGTSGLLKKTAADTYTLDTATYITSSSLTPYLLSADAVSTYQRLDKMVSNLLASSTEYPNSNAVLDKLALKADAANPVFTGDLSISGIAPKLYFVDTNENSDYTIFVDSGYFYIYDQTVGATKFQITPSGNAINAGTLTSSSFIKSGGTSSQFLKADGSVDSTTYGTGTGTVTSVSGTGTVSGLTLTGTVTTSGSLTLGGTLSLTSGNVTTALGFTPYSNANPSGYITSSALSSYLPLSGGTLTGALSGTSAGFSSSVTASTTLIGRTSYTAGGSGGSPYYDEAIIVGQTGNQSKIQYGNSFNDNNGTWIRFVVNGIAAQNTPIYPLVLAPTGAATFSSSVTAGAFTPSYSTSYFGTDGTISNYSAANYMYINGTGGLRLKAEGVGYQKIVLEGGTSNDVWISTANTERMRITSAGNVGIGTTAPNLSATNRTVLDINGTNESLLGFSIGGTYKSYIYNTLSDQIFWTDGARNMKFGIAGAAYMEFGTNNTERMRITSAGNVGIGTTSPNAKLHITTTTGVDFQNAIRLEKAGGYGESVIQNYYTSVSNYGFGFSVEGATRMVINNIGNVGIGTTAPASLLDVKGSGSIISLNNTSTGSFSSVVYKYLDSYLGEIGATGGSGQMQINMGPSAGWGGFITFKTDTSERMRITSGGNVLIASTTSTASVFAFQVGNGSADTRGYFNPNNPFSIGVANGASSTWYIGVNAATAVNGLQFHSNQLGGAAMTITTAGNLSCVGSVTATAFFESSDKTIKTLIEDNYQTKGIESVTAKLYLKNGVEELGYFAQDLQGILPSAVSKGADGLLNLSYREVHTAKIASLEKRVEELEAQLNIL